MFPAFDEIHWYVEGVVNISLETHLEGGAVATTSGNSSAVLIDGRHGGAEMDRGTLPAALGYEKLDERAISPRDPPLPTASVAHPFGPQREGADAVRVGRG